ncbi:MAG: hypothetical protein RLZZ59_173 [Pseudomonadota bacterium]|jgi:hypothetical protein
MQVIRLLITAYLLLSSTSLLADSAYPETRDERRAKEIGSMLGNGEGIVFRPGKIPNLSTQTKDSKINKHLWQATLDVVDFAPIVTSDTENGILVTDWYSNTKDTNRSMKLKIEITGNVISPESIKTELKQRVRKDGTWMEDNSSSETLTEIEDKILRRARQLYLRSHKK